MSACGNLPLIVEIYLFGMPQMEQYESFTEFNKAVWDWIERGGVGVDGKTTGILPALPTLPRDR